MMPVSYASEEAARTALPLMEADLAGLTVSVLTMETQFPQLEEDIIEGVPDQLLGHYIITKVREAELSIQTKYVKLILAQRDREKAAKAEQDQGYSIKE